MHVNIIKLPLPKSGGGGFVVDQCAKYLQTSSRPVVLSAPLVQPPVIYVSAVDAVDSVRGAMAEKSCRPVLSGVQTATGHLSIRFSGCAAPCECAKNACTHGRYIEHNNTAAITVLIVDVAAVSVAVRHGQNKRGPGF